MVINEGSLINVQVFGILDFLFTPKDVTFVCWYLSYNKKVSFTSFQLFCTPEVFVPSCSTLNSVCMLLVKNKAPGTYPYKCIFTSEKSDNFFCFIKGSNEGETVLVPLKESKILDTKNKEGKISTFSKTICWLIHWKESLRWMT